MSVAVAAVVLAVVVAAVAVAVIPTGSCYVFSTVREDSSSRRLSSGLCDCYSGDDKPTLLADTYQTVGSHRS